MKTPNFIKPNFDNIPKELKDYNQWVIWRHEKHPKTDKSTKVPYQANNINELASSTNPHTWGTFDQAAMCYEKHKNNGVAGIGFVFSKDDPFFGIDYDNCIDPATGEMADRSFDAIKYLDSYAEVSPSGTGVKQWGKGQLPGPARQIKNDDIEIEFYDRNRYFTMTGMIQSICSQKIEPRLKKIARLYERLTEQADTPPEPEPRASAEFDGSIDSLNISRHFKRLIERGEEPGHRSEAIAAVIRALLRAGHGENVIFTIFKAYPIGEKYKEKGRAKDNWLKGEIDRIRTKFIKPDTRRDDSQPHDSQPEQSPHWQIVTLEDVYVAQIEEHPIIKGFIHENDPTVIHAKGGDAKSLILQDIFMTTAAGMSTLWGKFQIPEPAAALIVQSENSLQAIHQRAKMKCDGISDYIKGLQNVLFVGQYNNIQISGYVTDKQFQQNLVDFCKRAEDENQVKIKMIGFDPLISFHAGDENENSAMRSTLDHIQNDIAIKINATPIVIHHDNRQGEIRGASAIWDWARNIIQLNRSLYKGEIQIGLKHEKCNNFEMFEPFRLKMDDYLNFEPLDESELMPAPKRLICENMKKAVENLGGRVETKTQLSDQYEEISGHQNKSTRYNHILPELGKEFLPDINYEKLRKLQSSINRALKGKYNTMGCLHKLLQDAFDSGHISQMPKFPDFKGKEAVVPPRIDWISDAGQWRVINHISQEDRYIFIFMKLTGCRPSEARAIRWIDIKPDHIIFEKTFGRGNELKEVKQKKIRTFPMIEALKGLFEQVPRKDLTFVFINPRTGKHYNRHINKIWYKACEKAEAKKVKLYNSTRHSFGCQMLNAGLDKAIVQRLLGHTDSKMTDRYAEYSTDSLKMALDNIVRMPQNLKVTKQGN